MNKQRSTKSINSSATLILKNMDDKVLNKFLEEVDVLIKELDSLESLSYDIGQSYAGSLFEGQETLAVQMENLAIAMTHETASQMNFMRENLTQLNKLIKFRLKYRQFSESELNEILNDNVSMKMKLKLSSRLGSGEIMLQVLNYVREDWHRYFGNIKYNDLKIRLIGC